MFCILYFCRSLVLLSYCRFSLHISCRCLLGLLIAYWLLIYALIFLHVSCVVFGLWSLVVFLVVVLVRVGFDEMKLVVL